VDGNTYKAEQTQVLCASTAEPLVHNNNQQPAGHKLLASVCSQNGSEHYQGYCLKCLFKTNCLRNQQTAHRLT
jgi:hypothetical protein